MERQMRERAGSPEDPNKIPVDDERIIIPVTDDKGVPKPVPPIPLEDVERIFREQRKKREYKNAGNN